MNKTKKKSLKESINEILLNTRFTINPKYNIDSKGKIIENRKK